MDEISIQYRTHYEHCPLCESSEFSNDRVGDCSSHPSFDARLPNKMQWLICESCGHNFIDSYFNSAGEDIVFSSTPEGRRVGHNLEANRKISSHLVEKVLNFKNSGRWLDIGFGNASLLFTAKEYGFEPVGVDLREDNVEILKGLGIEAYYGYLEDLKFSWDFSVISLMDVLEHVPFPRAMLEVVTDLLEKDGVLLISMPNSENIVWEAMSKQGLNPYYSELEHCHNFSRSRLYDLLREFKIEPVRYGISERYRVCMEVVGQKIC